MDHKQIAQKAAEMFQKDGTYDVLYGTSDGQLFTTPEEAYSEASKMADPVITTHYRDEAVRKMAQKYAPLKVMIFATDYLKQVKIKRETPLYSEYEKCAAMKGISIVTSTIFDFVRSRVFRSRSMVGVGQKDKIYMYDRGVVDAYFLRRYPEGMIWQVEDSIVLTCPTHTELMSGTYMLLFEPVLGHREKAEVL